jgi:hypothetical protein
MQRTIPLFLSVLFFGGLAALAPIAARAQNPPPVPIFPPPGFKIPPADVKCILPGNRLDLQCFIANDPDAKRIRAEEAALFQQALTAARSGKLVPSIKCKLLGSSKSLIQAWLSTAT